MKEGTALATTRAVPLLLVGITGFEPATSSSRTKRATKLRHIPVHWMISTRDTLVHCLVSAKTPVRHGCTG